MYIDHYVIIRKGSTCLEVLTQQTNAEIARSNVPEFEPGTSQLYVSLISVDYHFI
jgi:hypothetical protein